MSKRIGPGTCTGGVKGHPARSVKVTTREGNYSAFNGYRFTPSDYSALRCFVAGCGHVWRTKADYVDDLPDAPERWWER